MLPTIFPLTEGWLRSFVTAFFNLVPNWIWLNNALRSELAAGGGGVKAASLLLFVDAGAEGAGGAGGAGGGGILSETAGGGGGGGILSEATGGGGGGAGIDAFCATGEENCCGDPALKLIN